jgi:Tol biopolymer transport system component
MRVLLGDLERGTVTHVSHPPGTRVSRSAYNPTVSGDGRLVAYEAYERPEAADGRADVVIRDLRAGRTVRVPRPADAGGPPTEPRLSADGRVLAFTSLDREGRSRVYALDVETRRTRAVSALREEAWDPAVSADGRTIAYTATSGRAPASIVLVAPGRRPERIAAPARDAIALEPSLSADGRRVAFVARSRGDRRTQVHVFDAGTGRVELVSRGDGAAGAPSMGSATHPSISGDGRRVAFTSDAWDLSAAKCNSARGIFLRDLEEHTTRLVSRGDGDNRYRGPTKGSSTESDAFVTLLCA